jgi:hypothetical protein
VFKEQIIIAFAIAVTSLMPRSQVASDRPTYIYIYVCIYIYTHIFSFSPNVCICSKLLFQNYESLIVDSCNVFLQH